MSEDSILFSDDGVSGFVNRAVAGALPLLAYGLVGEFSQLFLAPLTAQLSLGLGFTVETPFSPSPEGYSLGDPGQDQSMQWGPFLRGQRVLPDVPIRSHTTGIIDYGVRHGWPFAVEAEELVHPGRTELIARERVEGEEGKSSALDHSAISSVSLQGCEPNYAQQITAPPSHTRQWWSLGELADSLWLY